MDPSIQRDFQISISVPLKNSQYSHGNTCLGCSV